MGEPTVFRGQPMDHVKNRRQDVRIRDYIRIRVKKVDSAVREAVREQIALERLSTIGGDATIPAPRTPREVSEHMDLPGSNVMNLFYALDAKLDAIMAFLIERDVEQRWGELVPVDLSASGVRFLSHERYDIKTLLRLEMMLQSMPPRPIITLAEVLRVDDSAEGKSENDWRIAVRFIDIDAGDRDRIVRRVFDVQRMMLRREREARDLGTSGES